MRTTKCLLCITLFISVHARANDDSPIDMAEMRDDSTLATEVVRDWHHVGGVCPTRQKHITIRVAQLWQGQEYRIPVRLVVPANGKARGFRLTGGHGLKDITTYFRLVPAGSVPSSAASQSRKSTPRGIDISAAVAEFAPGWSVSNCGDAMKPGLATSFRGRSNVLVTHPRDTETPCTLSKTIDIPAGKKTVLTVVVSHHQRGDWLLALEIDGQQKHDPRTISAATCPGSWQKGRVRLKRLGW